MYIDNVARFDSSLNKKRPAMGMKHRLFDFALIFAHEAMVNATEGMNHAFKG